MVGPDPRMKGGIASVVECYLNSEYVIRVELRYHATTVDGGRLQKACKALGALATFPAAALAFRPDVVHIHHASRLSFYRKLAFLLLSRALRLRTVVHCHSGTFADFHDASPVNAFFIERFLDLSDACIALSTSWKHVLAGYSRRPRIHVVPNPVDVTTFTPAALKREAYDAEGAERIILCMGRLGHAKGSYDLLACVPRVLQAFPEARFVLAGNGAVEEVRRTVCEQGLDHAVRTPGWVSGAAKTGHLASCDVYVLPSYREGMPVSILEAMAAGKPVVATRVGAIPEVLEDGVNGYLVAPGDVRGLADRIIVLLGAPALRREMGHRNRSKIEELFSMHVVVDTLVSVYESILER